MSSIATYTEILPGIIIEAVVDQGDPAQLRLHTWNGRQATTAQAVKHGCNSYVPGSRSVGLVQSVRFANPSVSFKSTPRLISHLRDFFLSYAHLQPEATDVLVAFALGTWFSDCMPVAPTLYLFGPEAEVSHILRLLSCCCRRSVLVGDIDLAAVATLPMGLGATLLINQRDLTTRVRRALLASRRRHFHVVHGSEPLHLHGAKAFSAGGAIMSEQGLKASISPPRSSRRFLADPDERRIAPDMQSKLLRYRLLNYEQVRRKKIDCSAFAPEMHEEAHAWLAPICNSEELTKSILAVISGQSKEVAEARFVDPKCLTAEAALYFCHKSGTRHFFVGELAEMVNVLLQGRHEDSTLSAKAIGSVLREIGLLGERVAQGYKVTLTEGVRQQIHRLALDYGVLSLDDGMRRCRYCTQGKPNTQRVQ